MRGGRGQLIVLILMLLAIPLTVLAVRLAFNLSTSADPGSNPIEVIEANITEASAMICWYTTEKRTGVVNYGVSATALTSVANDERDTSTPGEYNNHCVRLRNLTPDTTYFYRITSGSEVYNEDAAAQQFSLKTLPSSDDLATPDTLIGTITPPVTEGVLFAHASNGTKISTPIAVMLSSGNYAISKSNFRDKTTGDVFDLTNTDILISITDSSGQRGSKQVSASQERADNISLSAGASQYNPELVFSVIGTPTATPTATVQPTVTATPTTTVAPTTPPSLGSVNTSSLLSSKVSYGGENTNPTVPFEIFISNVSTTRFCVNWLTKERTTGTLIFKRDGQTEKLAIDERDNTTTQSKRYTHRVCLFEADFEQSEKVGFFIISNNKKYGVNLASADANRFVFGMPAVTDSPPSPGSIQGTIDKTFSSISQEARDVLVSARHEHSTGNSSWVSTIPSSNGSNWTMDYASILTPDLADYYDTAQTGSTYHIDVNGEYNSQNEKEVTNSSDIVAITLIPGLSVTNVNHEDTINSNTRINGTATPGSTVTITIGTQSFTVDSNSQGVWSFTPTSLSSGDQRINSVSEEGNTLSLEVTVSSTTPLPPTAIENYNSIIIGLILLVVGYILKKEIEKRRLLA